jgi:hypothetical protein
VAGAYKTPLGNDFVKDGEGERVGKPTDLVQGPLGMLILKTVALESMHGWLIAQRVRQVSKDVLPVN